MIEGRPRESLVQYENPIEVLFYPKWLIFTNRFPQAKTPMTLSRRHLDVSDALWILKRIVPNNHIWIVATKKRTQLPPMETKPSSEDILNAILPPREWVESGKCFYLADFGIYNEHL